MEHQWDVDFVDLTATNCPHRSYSTATDETISHHRLDRESQILCGKFNHPEAEHYLKRNKPDRGAPQTTLSQKYQENYQFTVLLYNSIHH